MNEFEKVIKEYLDNMAAQDADFRAKYESAPEKKDIAACCRYIISEVQKSGRAGFADPEIYGMAIHFYDETELTAPDGIGKGTVVVNHEIQLSAAEKNKIRKAAREEVRREAAERERKRMKDEEERKARRAKEKAEEAHRERIRMEQAAGLGSLFDDQDFA